MSRRRWLLPGAGGVLALVALLPAGATGSAPREGPRPEPVAVSDVRELHERAVRAWRRVRSSEGEERAARLPGALEALERVCRERPLSELCADAAFRAGELLRVAGESAGAARAFERARACSRDPVRRSRAGLELGHLGRRGGDGNAALDGYLAVALDPDARQQHRDAALLWAGDAWVASGREEDARRVWRVLADAAERPQDRVRAWERWTLLELRAGDVERASRLREECEQRLAKVANERTERGRATARALARMRDRCARELDERR